MFPSESSILMHVWLYKFFMDVKSPGRRNSDIPLIIRNITFTLENYCLWYFSDFT